jgi:hypothetical protein
MISIHSKCQKVRPHSSKHSSFMIERLRFKKNAHFSLSLTAYDDHNIIQVKDIPHRPHGKTSSLCLNSLCLYVSLIFTLNSALYKLLPSSTLLYSTSSSHNKLDFHILWFSMLQPMDSSSTIEFTPSNSDDNSYRDKAPMDDTINIKVPVAVAAEWIAKGVGVLGTQANHDKNHLAHIDSSRVGMNNREVLEDRVTKLEKNPFVDNNSINHMATQIIEKVHGKTATLREKWNVEELKKVTFKAATKKLDEKLNEKANGNLITDIKRRYTEEEKRMLKTFPLGTFQYNVESPQEVLPSTLPASFYRIESLLDTNRDPMPAPVGRAKLKKVSQAPKHDRAINNTFVPRSMDLHSTGPAMAHPDKSATEKQLEASLNIDRAVEAFRAHLEDAHITSLSDFDSAIEAFRTELLHDKPAEPMKIAVKELASCWVCGLTDHVTCACPKATCGDCGKVGHLGPFCPSLPCSGCDQEGHIVKDCPDAPECDNSLHHHNHQATKIENSPEQTGGMQI